VPVRRGLINSGPKSEASLWGRGGFINRRSPVPRATPHHFGKFMRHLRGEGIPLAQGSAYAPRAPPPAGIRGREAIGARGVRDHWLGVPWATPGHPGVHRGTSGYPGNKTTFRNRCWWTEFRTEAGRKYHADFDSGIRLPPRGVRHVRCYAMLLNRASALSRAFRGLPGPGRCLIHTKTQHIEAPAPAAPRGGL
jgi:hypothetical protein